MTAISSELLTLAASRYDENVVPLGHASVWGSWFCVETMSWGYHCCRSTSRMATPCQPIETSCTASETDTGIGGKKARKQTATADIWKARDGFQTPEGFIAYALQHFAWCWSAWLEPSCNEFFLLSAAVAQGTLPEVLKTDRAVKDAVASIKVYNQKLYQRSLEPALVSKLEEICIAIGECEYARANKSYMDLAIGTKKWLTDLPVSVSFSMSRQDTEIKWTPGSGIDPVDQAGLRDHLVTLKRIMSVLQAVRPNRNPSMNCG